MTQLKRVGILRGGNWENYQSSINEGGRIISQIFENLSDKWKTEDIFVDKNGVWHIGGIATAPSDLAHKVDLVWNTSSPGLGSTLENLSIPTVNISSFSLLLKNNQEILAEHIKSLGLKMPRRIVLPMYQEDFDGPSPRQSGLRSRGGGPENYAVKKAKEIWQKFSAPWIVKTFTPDADMGIHVAKTFSDLADAIEDGVRHQKSILVEELIAGINASAHSMQDFRGQDIYIFPIEKVNQEEKGKLAALVRNLHSHIGAGYYLKSDFTLHPKRGIFVTNVSFAPDFSENSSFHLACTSVGAEMHHVVEHILERAS